MQIKIEGYITVPDDITNLRVGRGLIQPPLRFVDPLVTRNESDLGVYAGKLVFIEADYINKDGTTTTYYNGEYACARSTAGTIYVTKLQSGYNGHELKNYALIGSSKYKIIDSYENDSLIRDFIQEQKKFAEKPKNGEKLNWVEYVYTGAADVARQLERALDYKNRRK
jgi:hypothetical protein